MPIVTSPTDYVKLTQNPLTVEDSEIDELLNQGKTVDELNESRGEKAKDALDSLIAALGAVSYAATLVSDNSRKELLSALVPMAVNLQPDEQDIERIKTALKDGKWSDDESQPFLVCCELVPPLPKFHPRTMRQLLTMPPKQWIIDQVIGAGDIGMVYGAPGCGKTFVIIDMIFSACLGQQFARRFEVARPLNVVYAAGEGISGLPSRFAAAAEHFETDDIANFTFFETTPQLYHDKGAHLPDDISFFVGEWKQRQADGEAQPLDILIIDTMHSATAGADENSAQHMGIVLRTAKNAAQELGCAVLLVHHTNKNGTAERGSSALRGAMDCMIEIRKISENDTGTKAVMRCAKLKDGEGWKDQTFDLVSMGESVRVWWDEPSDGTQSKGREDEHRKTMLEFMKSQPNTKVTAKILAEVAGVAQNYAIKLLAKMVNSGECDSALMDTNKPNSNRNPLTYFIK